MSLRLVSSSMSLPYFRSTISRGALPGRNPGRLASRLKFLGHGLEGFIHLLRFDFHPHQFFARGQIFYRYIHKQTFPLFRQ